MLDAFRRDERAIEGLPIRLVIALVVGVASLGVMMSSISGLGSLGVSEFDPRRRSSRRASSQFRSAWSTPRAPRSRTRR